MVLCVEGVVIFGRLHIHILVTEPNLLFGLKSSLRFEIFSLLIAISNFQSAEM